MTEPCTPNLPKEGEYLSDCDVMDGYRQKARERGENTLPAGASSLAIERAKGIRLLLLDVDGVLTDGTLLYSSSGAEYKAFNTQDGFGITLLRQAGIECGIITARKSEMVQRRAEELKMQHIYQGARKKNEAFRAILKATGFKPVEVAYMGDDWLDLVLLQQVGLALAPANGAVQVKERAHYVTPRTGGNGAVRDACDLLLSAKGELQKLLQSYSLG
ncbi:KdsC family phosphatase [Desulfopila aestuarii]|uniref:3-deoxy-D-manno-octulosonate 8-phosphate phosphatase KdsC n=1 Tax=Desulfopila aestuarii DSM 18488 TaxID=1121416 RepID=A0A1M7XW32_9BACT|nr:HAD hydrolase family protein [Desulfopila aestuarii]SHO42921.1 3-deoxy-D-manno-octulosonate 8-phosphate phosphatase (KDO 8-P phosphatase) [Desulfopila aestuarii DSM 18488]